MFIKNRRDLFKDAIRLAVGHTVSRSVLPLFSIAGFVIAQKRSNPLVRKRAVPSKPVALRVGELQVVFDSRAGLPYSYHFKGKRLWGEDEGLSSQAIVCRLDPRKYKTAVPSLVAMHRTTHQVTFDFSVDFGAASAVTYSLRYAIAGASLSVTLESVVERPGFQFIELAVPQLATVREEDGSAWMAEGRHGGSFVQLDAAKAYRFPDNEYFGRISTELPVGMVGASGVGCIMEVTAYMDGTETEIKGAPGSHHATLGCILTHRVHGGRCYSMNDGGPPVCGKAHTPNLLVGQAPRTQFDFFTYEGLTQPWLTGAKIMRSRMPPAPTQYLSDRFLYIVAGKRKIDSEPKTTFAQSNELVRDIALLTDHAPQVAFISGFAYDGQDTGFPSEDKINSSLGTDAELLALIQSGKELNANVSLNVNYDDAYKSSPLFNEAFIARRPDGEIWKSRAWDGEDSYVVGMAKYMEEGYGSKRIAFTADHFKIVDAILIDAMSWFAVRNDWDPQRPASGYKNLIDGKFKIIDQFRERGVTVTSEQLRYPMIGKLAESMDGPGVSSCPFGGEAVPMLSTIYRGAAIWGGTGDGSIHPGRELFWNTRSALWFQADTDRTRITDFYYLVVLPFSKLNRLSVERYESVGSIRCLFLDQRSQVRMDADGQTYTAMFCGVEIAKDDATFCPIDEHRIAFYSRTARQLRYPLPSTWDRTEVVARTLTLQGSTAFKMQVVDGLIVVDINPKQPVIVYANQNIIRQA